MKSRRELPYPSAAPLQAVAAGAGGRATAAPPQLSLHVERLVLHGLPLHGRDAARLSAAFEAEMTRLFDEGRLDPRALRSGALRDLRPGAISVGDGCDAERLGRELARVLQREWAE